MSSVPLIIGHRGASAVAPENTVAAFAQAMADGADGIEFDVRLARDGVPVVIHDAPLKRTGLMVGRIAELSSDELQRADVGSWFSRRFQPNSLNFTGERLPTLARVFDLFEGTSGLLYLEMKSEIRNDNRLAHDRRIRRSVELMHGQLDHDLSLKAIAGASYLSPFHFSRLFKKLTGTTPHAYLAAIRTTRAQSLLADAGLSVTEISVRVGYSSPSHFTKAFREATGLIPRAFRKALVSR